MLLFIIIGILFIASIYPLIRSIRKDDDYILLWAFLTMIFTGGIIGMTTELPFKKQVEYKIAKYNELKKEATEISSLDPDALPFVLEDVCSEIKEMNLLIERCKIYKDSPWIGIFQSKRVAGLEKLDYPSKSLICRDNK